MKIGDYITRLTGLNQYSPPSPRGGQNGLMSVDVLDVPGGGVQLNIIIEHKNLEDTTWTNLGTFTAITSTGVATLSVGPCKEMLRFRYSVSLGAAPQVYDTFYINVLAPIWRP